MATEDYDQREIDGEFKVLHDLLNRHDQPCKVRDRAILNLAHNLLHDARRAANALEAISLLIAVIADRDPTHDHR